MSASEGRDRRDAARTSKDSLRLWLRILKLQRGIEAELRERLRREFATTLPRFDVMAALYRYREGMKMSELSRALRVSNGNVTGIIDRLAEDGLAERVSVPGDRRAARVRLTEAGVTEFARQAEAHERWVHELLAGARGQDIAAIAGALGIGGGAGERDKGEDTDHAH